MATHTNNGGGTYGRKFSISRENGQVDKNGRPYFFEWVKELPTNTNGRKFETRTGNNGERHYELFAALDGHLIDVREETKDLGNGLEAWLILQLIDADEEYVVEVGRIDSRYSMDILKRLLDPNFDPRFKLRISPYSIHDEKTGRYSIGVSAISGVDGKLEAKKESAHLQGIPGAESREWKGRTEWDFSGVAKWLFDRVRNTVVPKLMKDPISAPKAGAPAHPPVPTTRQTATVPAGGDEKFPDDLPF